MYCIVWCNLHLCIIVKLRRRCLCYFSGICVKMLSLQAQTLLFALWSAVLQYFLVKIYKLKLRGVVKHVFEWHFKLFEFNLNCFSVLFLRWDFLSVLFLRFLHICISDGIFAKDCLLTGLVKSRLALGSPGWLVVRLGSPCQKWPITQSAPWWSHPKVKLFWDQTRPGMRDNLPSQSFA